MENNLLSSVLLFFYLPGLCVIFFYFFFRFLFLCVASVGKIDGGSFGRDSHFDG